MIKRISCSIVASLIIAAACGGAPSHRTPTLIESIVGKLWIHINGPWQRPPPEIGLDERTAPVTLVRFDADGQFSMIHCYVIEQKKKLTISNGDGQVIFLGSWMESGSSLDTTFRLVYETVQPVGGGKYPGPEERASASIIGHSLHFHGGTYDETKQLEMRNYDDFIAPEREKLRRKQSGYQRLRLRLAAPNPAAKRAFDAMMQMQKIDIAAIKAARRG